MGWIFFAVAILIVARSALGRALADRIRSGPMEGPGSNRRFEEFAARVTDELAALREDVMELQERIDFTERALTAVRRDALPPAAGT